MSYESYYWRRIIKRDVAYLRKKLQLTHKDIEDNDEEYYSNLEIKIMTLAYITRKLADSNKLPETTLHKTIKLQIHPRTKNPRRPFVDIDTEYDLNKKLEVALGLREVCNQIIHSYVLQAFGTSRRAFRYLYFVSDNAKDKGVYQMDLNLFIDTMLEVAAAYVTGVKAHYDSGRGEWIYETK